LKALAVSRRVTNSSAESEAMSSRWRRFQLMGFSPG
jgi:hypothetical protein